MLIVMFLEGSKLIVDEKVLASASASLDSDVADMANIGELEDAAFAVAWNLVLATGDQIQDYKEFFASHLEHKNSDVISVMSTITNVDWYFDEETISNFGFVVSKILEGIDYYVKHEKT